MQIGLEQFYQRYIKTFLFWFTSTRLYAKTKNHGDWEQTYSNIYKKFNYWTLYTLGTLNNKNLARKNYLVYNNYDDICYTGEDVFHFKKLVEKFNIKDLSVIVIENDKHSIVMKPIFELINFK